MADITNILKMFKSFGGRTYTLIMMHMEQFHGISAKELTLKEKHWAKVGSLLHSAFPNLDIVEQNLKDESVMSHDESHDPLVQEELRNKKYMTELKYLQAIYIAIMEEIKNETDNIFHKLKELEDLKMQKAALLKEEDEARRRKLDEAHSSAYERQREIRALNDRIRALQAEIDELQRKNDELKKFKKEIVKLAAMRLSEKFKDYHVDGIKVFEGAKHEDIVSFFEEFESAKHELPREVKKLKEEKGIIDQRIKDIDTLLMQKEKDAANGLIKNGLHEKAGGSNKSTTSVTAKQQMPPDLFVATPTITISRSLKEQVWRDPESIRLIEEKKTLIVQSKQLNKEISDKEIRINTHALLARELLQKNHIPNGARLSDAQMQQFTDEIARDDYSKEAQERLTEVSEIVDKNDELLDERINSIKEHKQELDHFDDDLFSDLESPNPSV